MTKTQWENICNLKLTNDFSLNNKWHLNQRNLKDNDLNGTLSYDNEVWSLVMKNGFDLDYSSSNIITHQTLSSLKSDVVIEIIDAFNKRKPGLENNKLNQLWNARGVCFYKDLDSVNAKYYNIIVSFGKFPDSFNYIENNDEVMLCKDIKIRDNVASVALLKQFNGYLDNSLNFKISFKKEIESQFALKVVVSLERLLEVIFNTVISPTDIFLANNDNNICKVFLPVDHSVNIFKSINEACCVYPFNNISDFGKTINMWFNIIQSNKKVYSLILHYLVILLPNMLETDKLINLTQGIEAYYSDKKQQISKDIKMANILENSAESFRKSFGDNETVLSEFNKFFQKLEPNLEYLKRKKGIHLLEKLDLMFKPFENNKLLTRLVDNVEVNTNNKKTNKSKMELWKESVKKTRVNITHGENNYPQLTELESLKTTVNILSIVVRYYIFKELKSNRDSSFLKFNLEYLSGDIDVWKNDLDLNY